MSAAVFTTASACVSMDSPIVRGLRWGQQRPTAVVVVAIAVRGGAAGSRLVTGFMATPAPEANVASSSSTRLYSRCGRPIDHGRWFAGDRR